MHITEEKGWQEVQKANTNQDEHPLTLVAMFSRSSNFLSISCERDLAPSPAPIRHISENIATSAQFGGEIHIAIQETGKGVTFGGIKQGGVELLLPPQQIRARHGWGNLLSHTSVSGSCDCCACRRGPQWSGSAAAVGVEGWAGRRRTRDQLTAMLRRQWRVRLVESGRTGLGIGTLEGEIDSPSVIPSRGHQGRNRLGLG